MQRQTLFIANVMLVSLLLAARILRKFISRALIDLMISSLFYGIALLGLILYGPVVTMEDIIKKGEAMMKYLNHYHLAALGWGLCLVMSYLLRRQMAHQMVSKPGYPSGKDSAKLEETNHEEKAVATPFSSSDLQVQTISALTTINQALQGLLNTSSKNERAENDSVSVIVRLSQEVRTVQDQMRTLYQEVTDLRDLLRQQQDQPRLNEAVLDYYSDSSLDEHEAVVAVSSLSKGVKQKKVGTRVPQPDPSRSASISNRQETLGNKTEREVFQELKKKFANEREANKEPEFLNEREREIAKTDLAMLAREWKTKRNPNALLRESDYRNLGVLDEEEAALPRRVIREIIGNQRKKAWIQAEKEAGREIKRCAECNTLFPKGKPHRCIPLGWTIQSKSKGIPEKKDLFISQRGKSINISSKSVVDRDKLAKNLEKYKHYQMVENKKVKADDVQTPPLSHTDATPTIIITSEKQTEVTSQSLDQPDSPLYESSTGQDISLSQVIGDPAINAIAIEVAKAVKNAFLGHFQQVNQTKTAG